MLEMINKNSISGIARLIPPQLVALYGEHSHYSAEQVKACFGSQFKTRHNIEYAFAMFCSPTDFQQLALPFGYTELRGEVAKVCFSSWPRFNFRSLLDYSKCATGGDGFVSFGGGGDGGCGGE